MNFRQITVKCPTIDQMLQLERQAIAVGVNTCLIQDAGHTEIEPLSRTVLAIGPAPADALTPITGHLKPY